MIDVERMIAMFDFSRDADRRICCDWIADQDGGHHPSRVLRRMLDGRITVIFSVHENQIEHANCGELFTGPNCYHDGTFYFTYRDVKAVRSILSGESEITSLSATELTVVDDINFFAEDDYAFPAETIRDQNEAGRRTLTFPNRHLSWLSLFASVVMRCEQLRIIWEANQNSEKK